MDQTGRADVAGGEVCLIQSHFLKQLGRAEVK